MITKVREVIDLLSHHLGEFDNKFPIMRREQVISKPSYPYGSWKLLSYGGLDYSIKSQVEIPDPTKIQYKYKKFQKSIVSLNFLNIEKNKDNNIHAIDVIHDIAQIAMDYLSVVGRENFQEIDVVVELINQQVQDRTSYLGFVYEYKVGFDFNINTERTLNQEVNAVDMEASIAEINYEFE